MEVYDNLKQLLDSLSQVDVSKEETPDDDFVRSTQKLREVVEFAIVNKDNAQGDEGDKQLIENKFGNIPITACKCLAEKLGARRYFFGDELRASFLDAQVIGPILSAIVLLDKTSWVYRILSSHSNLIGLADRFRRSRRDLRLTREKSRNLLNVGMFEAEHFVMEAARYDRLVQLVGFATNNEEPKRRFLISPFYPGGTLEATFHGLNWRRTLQIGEQVAYGIHMLHTCRWQSALHNDLNTSNICLDENGDAVVIDFGSCVLEFTSKTTQTLAYGDPYPGARDKKCDNLRPLDLLVKIL